MKRVGAIRWIARILIPAGDPTGRPYIVFVLLLFAALARADSAVETYRTDQPPTIDGILDDEVWKHATIVNDFLQRLPHEGAQPTEKTEVHLAYTSTALYIAF